MFPCLDNARKQVQLAICPCGLSWSSPHGGAALRAGRCGSCCRPTAAACWGGAARSASKERLITTSLLNKERGSVSLFAYKTGEKLVLKKQKLTGGHSNKMPADVRQLLFLLKELYCSDVRISGCCTKAELSPGHLEAGMWFVRHEARH